MSMRRRAIAATRRGRARAKSLMIATCTIKRPAGNAYDPALGHEVAVFTTIYTGPCGYDVDSTQPTDLVLAGVAPDVLARLLGETSTVRAEGAQVKVNLLLRRLPRLRQQGVRPDAAFGGTFHIHETLTELAAEETITARDASSGRGAHTVFGNHTTRLRQTVIALAAGRLLHEHNSPGDATLQVLSGRVRLASGDETGDAEAGELVIIPDARHSLEALDDSVVLLTVAL